ncbi:MAG TPA: AraC family transcriptional regulator [Puia sp.]
MKDSFSIRVWGEDLVGASEPMRAAYHCIFFVQEGQGELRVDDIVLPIRGPGLFLVAKGQLYKFHKDTRLTGYELLFGDCFWERTPQSANNCKAVLFNHVAGNQYIPVGESKELADLFGTLYEEYRGADYPNKLDALAAYLKIVMIKIANINSSLVHEKGEPGKALYNQFLELVGHHPMLSHEVAVFAGRLNISARRLTDLCNQYSHKGAKEIINEQIVAEAKRALQFSSLPVKEIAYTLNFSSPYQFSHFFKKYTQVSPRDYRAAFVQISI